MKLVFATHNGGKVAEMKTLMADLPVEVVSAEEAGVHEDPAEDGATFEENAIKKAQFVVERTGEWSVADDSGICIDALNGRPGVHTARWTDDHVSHTLAELKAVREPQRTARFVSAVALVDPSGKQWVFEGEVRGRIATSPRGTPRPSLPYDVVFIPENHNCTFAEMTETEKNMLSHRGKAFAQLKTFILKFLRT